MGLNLNSLRNLSTVPTGTVGLENMVPLMPTLSGATAEPKKIQEEEIFSTGPKISLMKLKKASGIDSTPLSEELSVHENMSQTEIEQKKSVGYSNRVHQEIIPVISEEVIVAVSPLFPVTKEVTQESQSIIIDSKTSESKEVPSQDTKTVEPKEFFPNFQISGKMNLDEDLLDFQDFITIKEGGESTILKEVSNTVTNEEAPKKEAFLDRSSPLLNEVISEAPLLKITPVLSEAFSDNTPDIASGYVAEVKAELSGQRRAGFRFFIQKKTKIIAGISLVVLSITAVALFSDSFLSLDMEKFGKGNVQEVIQDTPPVDVYKGSDTELATMPIPVSIIETPSYELGRDYSVAKNTKKNIQSKAPSNTSSGGGITTP